MTALEHINLTAKSGADRTSTSYKKVSKSDYTLICKSGTALAVRWTDRLADIFVVVQIK